MRIPENVVQYVHLENGVLTVTVSSIERYRIILDIGGGLSVVLGYAQITTQGIDAHDYHLNQKLTVDPDGQTHTL